MARDLDIDGRNTMDREQPNEAITAGELMSRSTTPARAAQ